LGGKKEKMDISGVLGILGFVIAIISLLVSFCQYKLHKRQLKTELLSKYCVRYSVNQEISSVVKYLEKEEGLNLKKGGEMPDDHEVEMFMRFFEEIELLIRSNSIDEKVVSYMFYFYLQTFDKLKDNWPNIDYGSEDWKVFHEFNARMKKVREDKNIYKID